MADLKLLYVTARTREQALSIGRTLVQRRLVACANVLPGMTSVYWWRDAVEEAAEAVLILKTDASHVDATIAAVKELHDYSVPCVLVLPIQGGNADYLAWLQDSVR